MQTKKKTQTFLQGISIAIKELNKGTGSLHKNTNSHKQFSSQFYLHLHIFWNSFSHFPPTLRAVTKNYHNPKERQAQHKAVILSMFSSPVQQVRNASTI